MLYSRNWLTEAEKAPDLLPAGWRLRKWVLKSRLVHRTQSQRPDGIMSASV